MTTLYLIRHGQASFGQENYDQLSELGEAQATKLGQALSQRLPAFDAVVLGTMQRHKQTAVNCLAGFDLEFDELSPQFMTGWNEYDHQDILAQSRPEFKTAASMMEFIRQQDDTKILVCINCSDSSVNVPTNNLTLELLGGHGFSGAAIGDEQLTLPAYGVCFARVQGS